MCLPRFLWVHMLFPGSTDSSLLILMAQQSPIHTFFCLSELPCGQHCCQFCAACHEIFTIPWVMFGLQGELCLTIVFLDQTWLRGVAVRFDPLLGLLTKAVSHHAKLVSYEPLFSHTVLTSSLYLTSTVTDSHLVSRMGERTDSEVIMRKKNAE